MAKTYHIKEGKRQVLEEPAAAYSSKSSCVASKTIVSARENVISSTMSVDEYFDELIKQVRHDYANL